IYGLITTRQKPNDPEQTRVYYNGDYASARGFEASLAKSFSHKFSAEINYTYSLATGVASNPAEALQFLNGGRLYLPLSDPPLDAGARQPPHAQNISTPAQDTGLHPYLNTAAGNDYQIYYSETGRAGGAYLKDINGDGLADWVPVNDPRVFGEGRNVRMGIS